VITAAVRLLRDPATIRSRCANIAQAVEDGTSPWFSLDPAGEVRAVDAVISETRRAYPDLVVPYHSRWRHFEAGGIDRVAQWRRSAPAADAAAQARADIDLAVVSVLLDAGAGPDWSYRGQDGQRYARSEGLGVASFEAFIAGAFSSDPATPHQADAEGLRTVDAARLGAHFQVGPDNPLLGLEGRAQLLRRLGEVLAEPFDSGEPLRRPGALFDSLTAAGRTSIEAADILRALLDAFSGVWLTPSRLEGAPLGDAWRHPRAGGEGPSEGWVPFHKLSQWLSYSLLEPFEWAGISVTGREALTALPEYRNGGLLLDSGWLVPRPAVQDGRSWQVGDEMVVEWRALTIHLVDRLATRVRIELGLDVERLPLASLLQGGTWSAGRIYAARLRGGLPPFSIDSDGTVF